MGWKPDKVSEDEILAYEIAEDNKLRRIGIDPDSNPIEIMLELERRCAAIKAERRARASSEKPD